MALQKTETLPSGYSANYWRLVNLFINVDARDSSAQFAIYKDATARQEGKDPIAYVEFLWRGNEFPFTLVNVTNFNVYQVAYAKAKSEVRLAGATDV